MGGFRVGGGRGRGVSTGKCLVVDGAGVDPLVGAGTGTKVCGNEVAGLDTCGCGRGGIDTVGGEGGGDGVVDVDRKVGPRGVDVVDKGESLSKSGKVRSNGCDIGRGRILLG